MELNLTKQPIYTNHICINQNFELSVDFDVNMPDYCAGIQRVLRCEISPYITAKNFVGSVLSVEGNACFSIIYLDDCGKMHSYRHSAPFSKSVETDNLPDECNFTVSAKCGYLNTKAVSAHRVEVHSVMAVSVKGVCKKRAEVICDIDNSGVYFNRKQKSATLPISIAEKNIVFEEELEVAPSQPPVCDVVRYCVVPFVTSHKIVNDKVIVKGELEVTVLYSADNYCNAEKLCVSVPFSQIVDVEGINEGCVCNVKLETVFADIKPRQTYDGEAKSFMLNAKICITVDAVCDNELPIICDAYSSKFDVDIKSENVSISNMLDSIDEKYSCKKNIAFSDGENARVIDTWATAAVLGYRADGKALIINGTVNAFIICESSDGVINLFEKPIDFEYRYELQKTAGQILCEPQVAVMNCQYSPAGENNIDLHIELGISASVYEINSVNAVVDVKLLENSAAPKREYSMIIYFAQGGESVWDIAKHYKASPDEIMKINAVDSVLSAEKALLIPC